MSEGFPIYLDNSATTKPFQDVVKAVTESMSIHFYNPSAPYKEAVGVEKEINGCRSAIAACLGCQPGEIIFTSGGTEANNLAILGIAEGLRLGRCLIFSAVEHPSIRAAFESLRERFEIVEVPADKQGIISAEEVTAALKPNTSLVSIMQINNEVGVRQPINDIIRTIKSKYPDTLVHVDGVQGFMRENISMRDTGIDLYSLSGHKIHGPKGIGALYCRSGLRLCPRQLGGGQEGNLRSGTENVPGIAGLRVAVEKFAANPDWIKNMRTQKNHLCELLLKQLPGAVVNGPQYGDTKQTSPHIVNISFPGLRGEVLVHALETEGVLTGTGSACSSRKKLRSATLEAMRLPDNLSESAIRLSLSPMTTQEDIDMAVEKIIYCVNRYSVFKRR